MRRLLLSLLLIGGFVCAADEPLQVYRFGGLNTVAGDFHLKPGEARKAHEVDFGRQLGCLMPRYGYDSVSAMAGMDSVVDIFGAYYSDGTQRLCLVADSDGVGYGNVYVTGTGSADLSAAERIWRYFSVQNKPSFAMLDDNIYIVNGSHKGIVYDGDNARAYPLPAPGEPLIVPLNDSGPLHGEYIYRISSDGGGWTAYGNGSAGYSDGIISSRVSVKNGKVLLTGFQWPPNDSLDYPDRCQMRFIVQSAQEDTYWIEIDSDTVQYVAPAGDSVVGIRDNLVDSINAHAGMTTNVFTMKHGNQVFTAIPKAAYGCYSMTYGPGDTYMSATKDSVWRMYIHRTRANPGRLDPGDSAGWIAMIKIDYNDTTLLETLTVIDSIADTITYTTKLYHPTFYGRDSTGTLTYRYGAPRYVSSDTTHPDGDTLLDIFEGWPTIQEDTLGVAYLCTFIDTATGIESDSGRSLFVFCDSGNSSPSYRQVTLKLPQIASSDSGIVVNLYRACIMQLGHDSTWYDSMFYGLWEGDRVVGWQRRGWINIFLPETVAVVDYHLLAQVPASDTIFIDNIPFDSLYQGRRYRKRTAPPMMTTIFSHDNRLFGTQKSGLYYSQSVYFDTLQSWGALALTPINPDDGDMATTAWPARGVIRVMKSYSNLNVYQDANLQWTRTEVSGYYGCIAGRSHTAGLGGHYYLSNEGVLREVEGMNLERTQQVSLLSGALNNFEQYDIAELSQAKGFYFDRKYMLCIGDTTYVWDDRAQAWSTWGLPFAGATLYGTEDEVRFLPGDTMYFIKPGESGLYRFATSDSDMTAPIEMTWRSGPLLTGPEQKRIHRIGRWINSTDGSGSVTLNLFDQESDTVGSMTFSSLTSRYLMKGFPVGLANLFEMEITSSSPGTAIEGFDLWYNVIGKKATQ